MRVFKRKRKVNGKTRQDDRFTLEFRTHRDVVARIPGFADRSSSEELGKKVDRLVAARSLNQPPDPDLAVWIDGMPVDLRENLARYDLLDRQSLSLRKPLSEHLTDFRESLIAKGNCQQHCDLVHTQAKRIVDASAFVTTHDIVQSEVERALKTLKDTGLSQQTVNHHVRAIKQFVRWMIKNKRMRENPIADLAGGNVEADRRLERRELTSDEIDWLLMAAANGPVRFRLSGEQRKMLYVVALASGLRASELYSLTPRAFDLTSDPPTVKIQAADEKAGRGAELPLPPDVAMLVKSWLAAKPKDAKLWAGAWAENKDAAKFLKADLESAKAAWVSEAEDPDEQSRRQQSDFLEYRNAAGHQADFHSLRHTYLSRLGRSGVPAKVMQKLARHSTVELTLSRYTHAHLHDLAGAVQKLPPLVRSVETHAATARATGTDGLGKATTEQADDDAGGNSSWTGNGPFSVASGVINCPKLAICGEDEPSLVAKRQPLQNSVNHAVLKKAGVDGNRTHRTSVYDVPPVLKTGKGSREMPEITLFPDSRRKAHRKCTVLESSTVVYRQSLTRGTDCLRRSRRRYSPSSIPQLDKRRLG